MLHSPAPGMVGVASYSATIPGAREDDLDAEAEQALLLRARDIIAGITRPPAMIVPPEVDDFLRKEFGGVEPPPTPASLRRISDQLSLQSHYGGRAVACFTMADGELAVLACGDREVEALLRGLSEEEATQVVISDTESF